MHSEAAARPDAVANTIQLKAILLVDDDKQLASALQWILADEDFLVDVAHNGEEAMLKVQALEYDIVICDLMMPPPDGFEVISALRDAPATSHIPIIVLTAHDLSREEREQLSRRVVTVLTKTCERAELLEWLSRVSPSPVT